MEKLTLAARVAPDEDGYRATIATPLGGLVIDGRGDTPVQAQDDLVEKFLSWIQARDGEGKLEAELAEVGFADVEESTELELEFVE